MKIQINTFENITKPYVISTTSLTDWLSQIKSSTYSQKIIQARKDVSIYNSTKASVPCVTYNFEYDGYKNTANTLRSTGVIYIDIDHPEFDINQLDKNKVYSYYHSFGGHGYAILVKVSGVTLDNFKSTYTSIINDLCLTEYVDIQAAKATQFNVISYDENIYINDYAFTYSAVSAPLSIVYSKKEEAYTIDKGAVYKPIRFDNLDEIPVEGDYVVNWDGYDNIKCFMPINKIINKRNDTLLAYCTNLVYLNSEISFERTYKILSSVNERICVTPVDSEHLRRIVKSVMSYKDAGTLKPIYFNKKRKIVFNKTSKLSREEKLEICRAEIIKHWKDISTDKLFNIIESWDFKKYGKISQRKIYNNHPINKKTVEKYWHLFKSLVNYLNVDLHGIATSNLIQELRIK